MSESRWSHRDDEESLSCETALDAAIEYIEDEIDEDASDDTEITVYEYKRMDIDRKDLSREIVYLIENRYAETYCGDNDDAAEITNEVSIAVDRLVDTVAREMPNYWYQQTNKSETKTIAQWRAECV